MNKNTFAKITAVFLLFFLFLNSCSRKEPKIPDGIPSPELMTAILVDMQIAEATLLHIQQNNINAQKHKKHLYDLIFEKHQITKQAFDSSFTYYSTKNIKALDKIYADVITALSQKQSEVKTQ